MGEHDHIFAGTFLITTDDFLLQPAGIPGLNPPIDVSLDPALMPFLNEHNLNKQQVSILGHMGRRVITGSATVPSLIAKEIAFHQKIAVRAYFLYTTGDGGSPMDNWLSAERTELRRSLPDVLEAAA